MVHDLRKLALVAVRRQPGIPLFTGTTGAGSMTHLLVRLAVSIRRLDAVNGLRGVEMRRVMRMWYYASITRPPSATTRRRISTRGRPTRGFKKRGELITHLLPVHRTTPNRTCALRRTRINANLVDRVRPRQLRYRHGRRVMRIRVVPRERLRRHEPQLRPDVLEALDGAPQPLAGVGFGAETLDEVEGHVELVADLAVEFGRGVGDGEEDDGEGGDEEVVEADLLRAVNVARFVEAGEHAYGVFGHLDGFLRIAPVFHDAGRRVQDWAVDEYAHLIRTDVQHDLEAELGAGFGRRQRGGKLGRGETE